MENNIKESSREILHKLCKSVSKKVINGKRLSDFDLDDWAEIAMECGIQAKAEDLLKKVIELINNEKATPINVKKEIVVGAGLIAEQTELYRSGKIDELEWLETCELICFEATIRAMSDCLKERTPDIKFLGITIESFDLELTYYLAREYFNKKECEKILSYIESVHKLQDELDEQYKQFVEELSDKMQKFYSLVDEAFDKDGKTAFEGSIKLAKSEGMKNKDILKNKNDIDNFFN